MAFKLIGKHIATCEISDFYEMNKTGKALPGMHPDAQRRIDNARNMSDSWLNDPDFGTPDQRFKGDFKYAQEIIQKTNTKIDIGNIESLQADINYGLYDGTEVDMDAYLTGQSNCLGRINLPVIDNGERTIKVAIGIGGNCLISAKDLVVRAAKVLSAVRQYEEAGYGIELYAMYFGRINNWKDISEDGDNVACALIDCSRAATGQAISAMASAKIFRTYVFACLATIPDIGYGLSYPIDHAQSPGQMDTARKVIKKYLGQNTKVVFAGADEEQIAKDLAAK